MERERARLEEEVRQLRAAVNIWTDVVRHAIDQQKDAAVPTMENR